MEIIKAIIVKEDKQIYIYIKLILTKQTIHFKPPNYSQ